MSQEDGQITTTPDGVQGTTRPRRFVFLLLDNFTLLSFASALEALRIGLRQLEELEGDEELAPKRVARIADAHLALAEVLGGVARDARRDRREAERDLAPVPPDPDDVAAPERPSVSSYLFAADAGAPRRRRAPDVWRFLVAGALFALLAPFALCAACWGCSGDDGGGGVSPDAGLEVLDIFKKMVPDLQVIMLTGHATVESAIEGMKQGAFDFVIKPQTPDEIEKLLDAARNLIADRAKNQDDVKTGSKV